MNREPLTDDEFVDYLKLVVDQHAWCKANQPSRSDEDERMDKMDGYWLRLTPLQKDISERIGLILAEWDES